MKTLKKLLIFPVFMMMLVIAHGQSLYFCEDVDSNGYPENSSTVFTIPSAGGYFYFLVRMGDKARTTHIEYDIYEVNRYGEEKYNTTVSQDIEYDWTYFYKQVTFYDAGKYKVYVYDNEDYLLTSGTVEVEK